MMCQHEQQQRHASCHVRLSHVGDRAMRSHFGFSHHTEASMQVQQHFRPEFVNRVDEFIVFQVGRL